MSQSAVPQKLTEQTCAKREERLGQGWSWSLFILLHRHIYFTFLGRILVTIVSSFLKSCLGLCCHLLRQQPLFYCNDSLHLHYSGLNAVRLSLCGLIIPFHSPSISWHQNVILTTSLSADRAVFLRLYM